MLYLTATPCALQFFVQSNRNIWYFLILLTMRICLAFLDSDQGPQLDKVIYYPETGREPIISNRGLGYSHEASFKWSSAVRALSILLLKHRTAHHTNRRAFIEGVAGSLAASLDYALSKQPSWMIDMFGASIDGRTILHRLLERVNGERKRPGPVRIMVREAALKSDEIFIFLNNSIITDENQILNLLGQLQSNFKLSQEENESPERVIHCFEELMGSTKKLLGDFTMYEYLQDLLKKQEILSRQGSSEMLEIVKAQIKRLCIFGEAAFAIQLRTDLSDKIAPRFSCSSLIDGSPEQYAKDSEWEYLLQTFKISFRNVCKPTRIFFVNDNVLCQTHFGALKKIFTKHLECGMEISLVHDSDITGDCRRKRNIAYFGKEAVLHATDQVDWDLAFSDNRRVNQEVRDKHEYFISRSFTTFSQVRAKGLDQQLREILNNDRV